MIINNQKYSCEACIRGHRVTTCKHHDRPLTRINRKGRPFSTCTVCHRTPCPSPDEHGRLRRERDDIHKKPHRYTRPFSGFLPIAPRPQSISRSSDPVNKTQLDTQTQTQMQIQMQPEMQPEMQPQTDPERQTQLGIQTHAPEILDFPFDMEFELPLDVGINTGIDTNTDTSTSRWPYPEKGYPEKGYGWEDIPISTPVPVPVPVPVSMPMQSMPWDMTMKGVGFTGLTGVAPAPAPASANEEWMGLGF